MQRQQLQDIQNVNALSNEVINLQKNLLRIHRAVERDFSKVSTASATGGEK